MKSTTRLLAALLATLTLSACQTPNLVLSPDLQSEVQTMEVSGRMGLTWGRTLRFGEFSTSKVQGGWPTMTRVNFVVKFEQARQKLSFTQFGPGGRSAEVLAVGRFRNTEISLLNGHLNYTPDYVNAFSGTVVLPDGGPVWDFLVDEPEGGTLRPVPGIARTQDGRGQISIEPVRRIEGQAAFMPTVDNWGFEFRHGGRVIGAVSLLNQGRVWMRQDISPELQQVVASMSSALLLRHSLRDWGE
jgi:hypothetical protein